MDNIKDLKLNYSEVVYRHYYPSWNNGKNLICFKHDDKNPSLSVFKSNGEYRHHCHACGASGDCLDLIGSLENIADAGRKISRLKEIAGIVVESKKIACTYDYTDVEGRLVFQTVKFLPKDFKQRRPDGKGGWIYNLQGVQLIPYNLSQFIKSKYCFIVEGEKDCETLKAIGITASCNPMGAGKWKPEYNEHFRGKRVYILPDNDKAGRDHAVMVARSLKPVAESIKVIELPGLPEKGDVSDWLGQGNTKERLIELCKSISEWTEPATVEDKSLLQSLIKWNDVHSFNTETEYLIDKLIPEGAITLLFGRGGIGKTSLALQMIHAIAEGKDFAGLKTKQTPVTYIDCENPLSVLKDRIKHIGKSDNILIWHGSCQPAPARLDRQEYIQYLDLPEGLIVFDTLRASFLGDENNSQDIAIIVDRLKQLRDRGFSVLLLHHTPKSNDSIYKGSTAILDLVDHALCLEPVKDDDEPVDFDPERTYRFGVKIKTRFEPHHIFLKFNPETKGFELAKDPDTEFMETMGDILAEAGKALNQTEFSMAVRESMGLPKSKTEKLIKRGVGVFWEEMKAAGKKSLLYTPKPISQFPNPIYSQEIRKYPSEQDKSLGNSNTDNSTQSIDNTAFPNFLNHVSGNQEIGLCSSCMLTPGQRQLCEVKKPCPKEVIHEQLEKARKRDG